jgi:hypothetical protein
VALKAKAKMHNKAAKATKRDFLSRILAAFVAWLCIFAFMRLREIPLSLVAGPRLCGLAVKISGE